MVFNFQNVNHAFWAMCEKDSLRYLFNEAESRAGKVASIKFPVIFSFKKPTQRVLLNHGRDANPFFHLYEALWMLAGRNDLAPLQYYNSRMETFSDDGKTFNGAYGYRWRKATANRNSPFETEHDQLQILINHLKAQSNSRRAVLQMWNVEDDLLKIDSSKDVCCNLSVVFSLVSVSASSDPVLNMTVFNRSNDLLWGTLGANYAHFTVLQEYIAACLGVEIGTYYQITNNLHYYLDRWNPETWNEAWIIRQACNGAYGPAEQVYPSSQYPLVESVKTFNKELTQIVQDYSGKLTNSRKETLYSEPFFLHVARPMFEAFGAYKNSNPELALFWIQTVDNDDWRLAGTHWLEKRIKK